MATTIGRTAAVPTTRLITGALGTKPGACITLMTAATMATTAVTMTAATIRIAAAPAPRFGSLSNPVTLIAKEALTGAPPVFVHTAMAKNPERKAAIAPPVSRSERPASGSIQSRRVPSEASSAHSGLGALPPCASLTRGTPPTMSPSQGLRASGSPLTTI